MLTCFPPRLLEKPGGSGMLEAFLEGRGKGDSRATTHCGGGGGGRADMMCRRKWWRIEKWMRDTGACRERVQLRSFHSTPPLLFSFPSTSDLHCNLSWNVLDDCYVESMISAISDFSSDSASASLIYTTPGLHRHLTSLSINSAHWKSILANSCSLVGYGDHHHMLISVSFRKMQNLGPNY